VENQLWGWPNGRKPERLGELLSRKMVLEVHPKMFRLKKLRLLSYSSSRL